MNKIIECPLCGYKARNFKPFGLKPRADAKCPHCGAVERHRLIGWYLFSRALLREGTRILDIAATPALVRAIDDRFKLNRVRIDLYSDSVDVKSNLENVCFGNEVFDAIFCVHVLEHVHDDAQALAELYRVLNYGGWALLMVPIDDKRENTDEDFEVVDPREREIRFGQSDHLRLYGRDFVQRCVNAGFRMQVIAPKDSVIKWHALLPYEKIHIGWKDKPGCVV